MFFPKIVFREMSLEENINIIVYSEESYTQETKDQLKIFKLMHINKNKHTPYFLIEDTHKIINATNKILPNVAHHFSEILDWQTKKG